MNSDLKKLPHTLTMIVGIIGWVQIVFMFWNEYKKNNQ